MLDKTKTKAVVNIESPKWQYATITIIGTAAYVSNKFSRRAREKMMADQMEGSRAKKGRKREPKDFDALWTETLHQSKEGWYGIPASSIRNALISACRTVGFVMTRAKLSLFVEGQGADEYDGQPLLKIDGTPRRFDRAVRVGMTTDILPSAIFDEWSVTMTVKWDGDQFSSTDIINLFNRAGEQVGIGAGRPDSRSSNGMGWGTFTVSAQ